MLFVPVVPSHATPPSPRTRELADLLGRVLEEYGRHHPSLTGTEVREAMRLARRRSSPGGLAGIRMAGLAAGVVAGGVAAFMAVTRGESPEDATPMIAVAVAVLAIVLAVAVVVRRDG